MEPFQQNQLDGVSFFVLTHPVATRHSLMYGSVQGSQANLALGLLLDSCGSSGPLGLQAMGGGNRRQSREMFQKTHFNGVREEEDSLFAVSTPGGEELHHPHLAALQHQLVEVVVGELHHVLLAAAAAPTALLLAGGARALLPRSFLWYHVFLEARTCLL